MKAIIQSKTNTNNTLEPTNTIEQLLRIANHPQKRIISKLYKVIASSFSSITLPIAKWENDLVLSPTPDFWTNICRNIFSMTSNTNLQLIQYKTIHRTHITQSRLHKMGTVNTDICPHCTSGSTDTYLHATWNCQPVNLLWTSVIKTLSTILDCRIPLSPTLCLLGDTTSTLIPQKIKYPVLVSLTIAKKVVFKNWKSRNSCHINHWFNLMSEHILTEELIAQKNNNTSAFEDIWRPFITFFQTYQ